MFDKFQFQTSLVFEKRPRTVCHIIKGWKWYLSERGWNPGGGQTGITAR